ncbi:MASE1 domain-containing protein [Ensifer sp. IC4062]|nr:MASE1 domain-containing protein [Ensifer sp. IC4062]
MISVWLHRPRFLHLGLFVAGYVLGCAFANVLGIVPGTSIAIWTPGGLFMATLMLASTPSWPWWVLAGCVGELIGQFLWFHSPLPASLLMYVGNALEAVAGAWLVIRVCGRPVRLETLKEVLAFVVLGAGIAPAISATVGSATLAWFDIKSQTFTAAWPLWWIGDATGVLIVAPLALDVFQNWHGNSQLSAARWVEASVLGLIFLGVAALSLSGYLPFAYIIMPPLLWAAVRFELRGAAVTLIVLALITAVFTISGASQFAGDPESQRQRQIMLQLFLAISALSALIVAAISRQHQLAVLKLRQSERSLRDLVETLPALIWCAAPDGKPIYFSQQLSGFIGFGDQDVADTSRIVNVLDAIIHPDDLAAVKKLFAHSLATGEPYAQKHRLRRFDGEYRWVEIRAAAMRNSDGAIMQWNGVCLDIEDQVRARDDLRLAQENLARASQAASLAELSASIAHEVNQPLAAIVANSHAGQRWLMAAPPNIERAQKRIERIIQDANSAADVVSHIRALFKHSIETRTSTTLASVIAEARDLMAEEAARRRVRMDVDVESNLPFVTLDRVQIQQVLINLIRNGMDAMDSATGDRVFGIRVRRMGDVVQTEISDHGPGVSFPDRIFEPFFTTKEHGMGMGLAICRSIVESHGGRLWAENNEPHGATFIFTLPVDATADAPASRAAGNQNRAS